MREDACLARTCSFTLSTPARRSRRRSCMTATLRCEQSARSVNPGAGSADLSAGRTGTGGTMSPRRSRPAASTLPRSSQGSLRESRASIPPHLSHIRCSWRSHILVLFLQEGIDDLNVPRLAEPGESQFRCHRRGSAARELTHDSAGGHASVPKSARRVAASRSSRLLPARARQLTPCCSANWISQCSTYACSSSQRFGMSVPAARRACAMGVVCRASGRAPRAARR